MHAINELIKPAYKVRAQWNKSNGVHPVKQCNMKERRKHCLKLSRIFTPTALFPLWKRPSWTVLFHWFCRKIEIRAFLTLSAGRSTNREGSGTDSCCSYPFAGWHLQKPLLRWAKLSQQSISREVVLRICGSQAMNAFVGNDQHLEFNQETNQ